MYWDIFVPLSFCALWYFIVGVRGGGKSYGCKKYVIERFLETGEQFGYIRRYAKEYAKSAPTFFNDIRHEFPNHEFKVDGRLFYVDGEVAGYGFVLSTAKTDKSIAYPNIWTLVFDEFLLDPSDYYQRYLPNEVMSFLDIYESIARFREVKVFFLGNALTFTNPYFIYFDIVVPQNNKKIARQRSKKDIVVQLVEDVDYINAKKDTRFGKLIEGTQYSDYAVENKPLRDNKDFILKKPPKDARYYFTMQSHGVSYGIWVSNKEGIFYVSTSVDPSSKLVYVTMKEDHTPNTILLKGSNKSNFFNNFVKAYKNGYCYFDSIKTKNVVLETVKNTI